MPLAPPDQGVLTTPQPAVSPAPPAFDAPVAPPVAAPMAAVPLMVPTPGPGWWHTAKAGLVGIGEKAAAANRERRQTGLAATTPPPVPTEPAAASEAQLGTVLRDGEQELNTVLRPGVADAFHADGETVEQTVLRQSKVDADPDRTVLRKPAAEVDTDRTVLRKPAPQPSAAPAPGPAAPAADAAAAISKQPRAKKSRSRKPSADVDRAAFHKPAAAPPQEAAAPAPLPAVVKQVPPAPPIAPRPVDPDRTRRRPRSQPTPSEERIDRTIKAREREPGELNLWDDYGIADSPTGFRFDPNASRSEQFSQALGASAMPTAKVVGFIGVLVATLVVLAFLVGRLINMDAFIGQPSPTAPSLASAAGTPAMHAGAQQCTEVVWAGEQTSCALAVELASQVPLDMVGTETIEVRSASQGRSMQLQCTADQGISCQGAGDAQNVLIWLVV